MRSSCRPLGDTTDKVIGIGASAGGVATLGRMLPEFPAGAAGVVVIGQHMPDDFAKRLNQKCAVRVSEARDGDRILRGHVLVAPGGSAHCEVRRMGAKYRIRLVEREPVSGHVPSVDGLFESLAQCVGITLSVVC